MADSTAVIGLDVGGTKILGILVDRAGTLIARRRVATPTAAGGPAVLHAAVDVAQRLAADALAKVQLVAVGMGTGGQIDQASGSVGSATALLPGWAGLPLRNHLAEALGVPATVLGDAQAAGLGEMWLGAARGARHFVCLTIGTGVGGGVFVDGRMVTGSTGSAGEAGHIRVALDGPVCSCGGHGCLEALISGPAIARQYHELTGKSLSPEVVLASAESGDPAAIAVTRRVEIALATGLMSVINLLNPELIVVGGGVMTSATGLLKAAAEQALAGALPHPAKNCRIVPALLGGEAGAFGAARAAWDLVGG